MAALIGYARISTADQATGLKGQEHDLKVAGCAKLFLECVAASKASRPQLEAALDWARRGDALMVTKPDRMARSTADLLRIVTRLEAKGVGLIVLSMGGHPWDIRTPTGRLMLTMMAAVAEFEKALTLERQREGIAKAKVDGKYQGRPRTAMCQAGEVARLRAAGMMPTEIARRLSISRVSVYRALKEAGVAVPASIDGR